MDIVTLVVLGSFMFFFLVIITLVLSIKYLNLKPKQKDINYFQNFIEGIAGIKVNKNEIENASKNLFIKSYAVWDPIETLNIDTIKKNAAEIEVKIEELKKDPGQINRHLKIIAMLGFLVSTVVIYIFYISDLLLEKDGIKLPLYVIIFSGSIFYAVKMYYILLTKDLVKLEIAKEKNWIYDPNHDSKKFLKLKEYFPEIYTKGNQNQYIEDQFWGIAEINNQKHYFYTGLFYYEIVSGSGKNRSVQKITTHYFIFPLKKDINARFHLYPENIGSKIINWFTKKEINVESNEFNKTFAFTYDGNKGEKAQEIVKTITPIMQEKLIKLYKQKNGSEILFARNTVVFLFKKDLIDKIKTDFRENAEISKEDLKEVDTKLEELIKISEEMSKYLD